VPSGATSGAITVTTPSGAVTSAQTFTVIGASQAPTIAGFSPSNGPDGTSVAISGANFSSNPSDDLVYFNVLQGAVTSASGSLITATVPVGATTGPVTVITPAGQGSTSNYFFVTSTSINVGATAQATMGGSFVTSSALSSGQSFLVAFNGQAGQAASIGISDTSGSACPTVTVNDPFGNPLTSYGYCWGGTFVDALNLPVTGTYSVIVTTNQSDTVTVTVYNSTPIQSAIVVGGPRVTVNPAAPGQDAYLLFAGSPGQQISLGISNSTLHIPSVSIINPDGTPLVSTGAMYSGGAFIDVQTLTQTGPYTVFVDTNDQPGQITLALYDATPVHDSITFGGTVTESLNPGQDAYITFSGSANQLFSLNINHTLSVPSVSVLKPDGTALVSTGAIYGSNAVFDSVTLPLSGTYTICVDTNGQAGNITLQLYDATPLTGSLVIGGLPVTVYPYYQDANLTFAGTAGQTVALYISTTSLSGPTVSILKPDG